MWSKKAINVWPNGSLDRYLGSNIQNIQNHSAIKLSLSEVLAFESVEFVYA